MFYVSDNVPHVPHVPPKHENGAGDRGLKPYKTRGFRAVIVPGARGARWGTCTKVCKHEF